MSSWTLKAILQLIFPTKDGSTEFAWLNSDLDKVASVDDKGAFGPQWMFIPIFNIGDTPTTGDGKAFFGPVPPEYAGFNITDVRTAAVNTKGTAGTMNTALRRQRAGAFVDVLSTLITHGDEWVANDGVINPANDDLAAGDCLLADIDATRDVDGYVMAIKIEKP